MTIIKRMYVHVFSNVLYTVCISTMCLETDRLSILLNLMAYLPVAFPSFCSLTIMCKKLGIFLLSTPSLAGFSLRIKVAGDKKKVGNTTD